MWPQKKEDSPQERIVYTLQEQRVSLLTVVCRIRSDPDLFAGSGIRISDPDPERIRNKIVNKKLNLLPFNSVNSC